MGEVVGVLTVVVAAGLAYLLGLARDRRAQLRVEQIQATTAFCRLLMEYSGHQLRRGTLKAKPSWLPSEAQEYEELVMRLRDSRAAVWASYFHVVLVIDDKEAATRARHALDSANAIRRAGDGVDEAVAKRMVKDAAAGVRVEAENFVLAVAAKLGIEVESLKDSSSAGGDA